MSVSVYCPDVDEELQCYPSVVDGWWIIEPQIYHPNVFFVGSCCYANTVDELKSNLVCPKLSDPSDIDAAIDFRRNFENFKNINQKLKQLHQGEECPICFEKLSKNSVRITCHNMHFACYVCHLKLKTCPMCRKNMYINEKRLIKKCVF